MAAGIERPWRRALRLDFIRPARLFGPVLHLAFSRLALICFSVAMMMNARFTDQFCFRLLARPELATLVNTYFAARCPPQFMGRPGLAMMMRIKIVVRRRVHLLARPVAILTTRIYVPMRFRLHPLGRPALSHFFLKLSAAAFAR